MGQSLVDIATQIWVRLTGRKIRLGEHPWLEGPIGDTDVIGEAFFHRYGAREGLSLDTESEGRGLLPTLKRLDGPGFDSTQLSPQVAQFYTETSRYSFEVNPEWRGGLRPFAWLISLLFSKRLRQLNIPLSSTETAAGASSDVFPVSRGEQHLFSAWIRTLKSTGNTLYAGAYSTAVIPGHDAPCIKVVFPLPNGSAMVFMRPEIKRDGSLLLLSEGRRFGEPGFYFYVRRDASNGVARYVRALKESIHVYPGDGVEVRAEHNVRFMGIRFLTQRYVMRT